MFSSKWFWVGGLFLMFSVAGCAEDDDSDGTTFLNPDSIDDPRWGDLPGGVEADNEAAPQENIEDNEGVDDEEGGLVEDPPSEGLETPPGHSGSLTQCGTLIESEAFTLLNDDRKSNGLQPLQCDDDLLIVARLHNQDMADRNFFAHTNPDGEQPWDRMERFGITGWSLVGENIAAGQRSPAEVQAAWMNSPGHRANILTADFTHVGVGHVATEDGRIFWTQLFARF